MRTKKLVQQIIFSAIAFLSLPGCFLLVGGAVGAAAAGYIEGVLKAERSASLSSTYEASKSALIALQYQIGDQRHEGLTAHIETIDSKDKRVVIDLESKDEKITHIKIRVGIFGDEARSRLILKEIDNRL